MLSLEDKSCYSLLFFNGLNRDVTRTWLFAVRWRVFGILPASLLQNGQDFSYELRKKRSACPRAPTHVETYEETLLYQGGRGDLTGQVVDALGCGYSFCVALNGDQFRS